VVGVGGFGDVTTLITLAGRQLLLVTNGKATFRSGSLVGFEQSGCAGTPLRLGSVPQFDISKFVVTGPEQTLWLDQDLNAVPASHHISSYIADDVCRSDNSQQHGVPAFAALKLTDLFTFPLKLVFTTTP
jgi:hypothetical protein